MLRLTKQTFLDRGYTLIELLVVIVIVGILASIALPSFLRRLQGCFLNQDTCMNQDPISKQCHQDATTKDKREAGPILIQLRYSPKCHTTWPRVFAHSASQIAGAQIYVLDDKGQKYGLSQVSGGYNNYYGDMGPGYALGACVILTDATEICTEKVTVMLDR